MMDPRDEEELYAWSCLQGLRSLLSAETFAQCERELGFTEVPAARPASQYQNRAAFDSSNLPF